MWTVYYIFTDCKMNYPFSNAIIHFHAYTDKYDLISYDFTIILPHKFKDIKEGNSMFCYWVRNLISLIDREFFFYFQELNIFFKSVRPLFIYQSLEIKITIIMNNTLDFKKASVTIEYNCFSYVLMICTYTWFFFS